MNDTVIHHEQPTGETCVRCDCELVLVSSGAESQLHLECDCGVVTCLGTAATTRLSAA